MTQACSVFVNAQIPVLEFSLELSVIFKVSFFISILMSHEVLISLQQLPLPYFSKQLSQYKTIYCLGLMDNGMCCVLV